MSEHDAAETQPEPQQELPPIPDGGLGKGLPSWLAAPPSRPVKPAGAPTPIDLGSLGDGAQLPQWLQDLSDRVDQDGAPTAGIQPGDDAVDEVAPEPTSESIPEPPVVAAPPVDTTPTDMKQPIVPTPESRHFGLYLLLAVAAVVIVVLVALLVTN